MTMGVITITAIGTSQVEADIAGDRVLRTDHPTNSLFLFGMSSLLKLTFSSSSFSFSTSASASGTTSLQSVRKLPGLALLIA